MPPQVQPIADVPISLDFSPGVQRDGTRFDANRYLHMLWCRFRNSRPRKILGYVAAFQGLNGVPRKIHIYYSGDLIIVHVGTTAGIQQVILDPNGNFISSADRTPLGGGFPGGPAIGWTLDALFDTTSTVVQLVAHPATDTQFLAGAIPALPLVGQIDAQTPLQQVQQPANIGGGIYIPPSVTGGIVAAQPYVFAFGAGGQVNWSAPNIVNTLGVSQGTTGAGTARISAQKIVYGYPLRGGGAQSPAALFWSISELIGATFIGGTPVFAFNTISPSTSILSSDTVIEYDGLYFWAGIDRFMVFNGTTVEVLNTQNQDWFFDNMNWNYAVKSFAFKVPRFGEIWFCAPLFGATEPSHAAIFNVRENVWYDTALPNGGRSCGYLAQGIRYPLMGGSVPGPNGKYTLWLHENGYDQVTPGQAPVPIRSYFETPFIGGIKNTPPNDQGMSAQQLEPDFKQFGDMFAYMLTSANSSHARQGEVQGPSFPIRFVPQVPQEQLTGLKSPESTARLMRLHIESNVLGGYYESGRHLLHAEVADARRTS
jgi:hypothetical protein